MVNRIYNLFAAIVTAIEKLAERLGLVETAAKKTETITEGIFPVERGGTGKNALTDKSILLGGNAVGEVANAKGVLVSDGSSAPQYTEILPENLGGTGRTNGALSKPVLLWAGTWTSGNLTVAESGGSAGCTGLGNISDYKWVRIERGDMVSFDVPVYTDGLYFGGIWGNSDGQGQLSVGHIRRSGNVLTYYYNTRFALVSFAQNATNEAITAIYGLVRTSDIRTA